MDETTAPTIAATWAGELLNIDETLRFTAPHLYQPDELPDVVAMYLGSERVSSDDDFPRLSIQQSRLLIVDVELSMMVLIPSNEEEAATRWAELQGFAKTLGEAHEADDTLGGEVNGSTLGRWEIDPMREIEDQSEGPALLTTMRLAASIPA